MGLATYRAPDIDRALSYIGPHGNVSHKTGTVTVPATATNGQTIDFMRLPVGAQILDAILVVQAAPGASVTLALGIAQIPGHLNTKVDVDGLIIATAAATTVVLRRNNPVVGAAALLLDDDYLIQGVIGGADVGAVAVPIDCIVFYENRGTP